MTLNIFTKGFIVGLKSIHAAVVFINTDIIIIQPNSPRQTSSYSSSCSFDEERVQWLRGKKTVRTFSGLFFL